MIKVLNINKEGNRVKSYTCTDGSSTAELSKEQLISHINNGNVSNARIQVYKGNTIIRVADSDSTTTRRRAPRKQEEEPKEKFKRTPSIASLSKKDKYSYYFDVMLVDRIKTRGDWYTLTLDEIDCVIEGNIQLEVSDTDSSTFEATYKENINAYPTLAFLRALCYRNGMLSPDLFDKYIIGVDESGNRVYNNYTFTEWVLKNNDLEY